MAKPPFIRTGGVSVGGFKIGAPGIPGVANPFASAKVDFDRGEFDALLEDKGYDVLWEKASICPNRPREGLAPLSHDVNCKICDGVGFIYFKPCKTKMLIQGMVYNESFKPQGDWAVSRVTVTARPGHHISYWDRITMNVGLARFTELVLRQPSSDDFPKYKPICVEYVGWVDRNRNLQAVESPDNVFISSSGTLSWSGTKPDGNSYYTISYTYRPRFIVQDMVHQIRDSTVDSKQVDFPVTAVARADFLVRDESRDPSSVQRETGPFEYR